MPRWATYVVEASELPLISTVSEWSVEVYQEVGGGLADVCLDNFEGLSLRFYVSETCQAGRFGFCRLNFLLCWLDLNEANLDLMADRPVEMAS
jgi:hypothetical protein